MQSLAPAAHAARVRLGIDPYAAPGAGAEETPALRAVELGVAEVARLA